MIEGALELVLGDETHRLTAGDVAHFDGARDISPTDTGDTTALIVLARRADD